MWVWLMPYILLAQKQDSCCVYKLKIEVRDLDTDFPLEKALVKITSTEGDHAEFYTDISGNVTIEKFIQPEKEYPVEVSCKGYYLGPQQTTVTGRISTIKQTSQEFYRSFKLRRIPYKSFSPALYDYKPLNIPEGSTILPDDAKLLLDQCVEESKRRKTEIVLLVPYGGMLTNGLCAKLELAKQYLLKLVPKNKVVVIEKPGVDKEGIFVKTI